MSEYTVKKLCDSMFGDLTILVSIETGCWFIAKEICKVLKTKTSNKTLESVVSSENIIKLRAINHRQNKDYSECLWTTAKDHADKYLINKFGVLQLIHSLKSYNTNSLVEHFIGITFKKTVMMNVQQAENSNISELDKQRLRLFSDNKFEVIEAHKAILKIEKEKNKTATQQNVYIQSRLEQERINTSLESELTKLRSENNILKNQIGKGTEWCTVGFKKREWKNRFGHSPDWKALCRISERLHIPPIKDVIEKDKNGIERKVNRYHVDVWNLYEFEEIRQKTCKHETKALPDLDVKLLPFED